MPFCGGGGYWAGGNGWAMASGGAGASWLPCRESGGRNSWLVRLSGWTGLSRGEARQDVHVRVLVLSLKPSRDTSRKPPQVLESIALNIQPTYILHPPVDAG